MGQVAVAAGYRGQRVFDRMYAKLREAYLDSHDFVVTEVSARNPRSLAAHYRVGFKDLVSPDADCIGYDVRSTLAVLLRFFAAGVTAEESSSRRLASKAC